MAKPGLGIEPRKSGDGPAPRRGGLVAAHFAGRFTDGQVFDRPVEATANSC